MVWGNKELNFGWVVLCHSWAGSDIWYLPPARVLYARESPNCELLLFGESAVPLRAKDGINRSLNPFSWNWISIAISFLLHPDLNSSRQLNSTSFEYSTSRLPSLYYCNSVVFLLFLLVIFYVEFFSGQQESFWWLMDGNPSAWGQVSLVQWWYSTLHLNSWLNNNNWCRTHADGLSCLTVLCKSWI